MNTHIPHYLIESFITAAEAASFQVAADSLKITQSTLSKQMILFEEMLPHKVFTFDGRKKVLTNYGRALYEALMPRFAQTQELIEQTSHLFSSPENIELKICGRGELLDLLALNLKFVGRISFMPMGNDDALEAVLHRKADIAIVHTGANSSEIIMKPFLTNSFKIAVSKALLKPKPKSEKEFIDKIKSLPCLLYKDDDLVFKNFLETWKVSLSEVEIHRSYPNYTTLARMINQGHGWAILPSHTYIDEDSNHVMTIPISATSKRFYFCYRKDLAGAGWMKNLIGELKDF